MLCARLKARDGVVEGVNIIKVGFKVMNEPMPVQGLNLITEISGRAPRGQ